MKIELKKPRHRFDVDNLHHNGTPIRDDGFKLSPCLAWASKSPLHWYRIGIGRIFHSWVNKVNINQSNRKANKSSRYWKASRHVMPVLKGFSTGDMVQPIRHITSVPHTRVHIENRNITVNWWSVKIERINWITGQRNKNLTCLCHGTALFDTLIE